jgi:hypothetical protein
VTDLLNRRDFIRTGVAAGLGRLDLENLNALASPATVAPRLNFVNAIDRSGISFVLDNSWSPRRYQVETMAGGVALFDYNNDSLLDLYSPMVHGCPLLTRPIRVFITGSTGITGMARSPT